MSTRPGRSTTERAALAGREQLFRVEHAKELNQRRDRARPSRLVAGAQARAVVAVEILVEEEVVAPVRVLLERLRAAVDRPSPCLVLEEDAREAVGDVLGDL